MVVISFAEFPLDAVMIFGVIPIGVVFIVMIAVGFILSFIFSNYEGSVKDSVLASCKNIISVLLGIVNVFSDILSYVRLWAVGLAGSAISSTVNGMAVQIAGTAEPSQIPFFVAACDYTLIGEELFAASAYLSKNPREVGSLKGQDMVKVVIIVAIIIGTLLVTISETKAGKNSVFSRMANTYMEYLK